MVKVSPCPYMSLTWILENVVSTGTFTSVKTHAPYSFPRANWERTPPAAISCTPCCAVPQNIRSTTTAARIKANKGIPILTLEI
ncbi:unnamed protein product [Ixodes pacificus]